MELFDILDETTKEPICVKSRDEAHTLGLLHQTVHVWVVRENDGVNEVLLQQRSHEKDSFPDMWDMSSAGHMSAGQEPIPAALREMEEELGIKASERDLKLIANFRLRYDGAFHGKEFHDNEWVNLFVYDGNDINIDNLTMQEEEVQALGWFSLEEVVESISNDPNTPFCMCVEDLNKLVDYLINAYN